MLLRRIKAKFILALIIPIVVVSCSALKSSICFFFRDVSPWDYGLATATTGIDRYNVLLETHKAANKLGVNVSYKGIKRLEIEVPQNASQIPLTEYNDFEGCELVVTNRQETVYLFSSSEKDKQIKISKSEIDKGDFRNHKELREGKYLLLIKDSNPWVENRRGYSYGHIRRDILLLKNGRALNSVVMSYNNEESNPVCSYINANKNPFIVKNLTIRRTDDCTEITNVLFITKKNNVQLTNLTIHTPDNEWRNDRAIRIEDCTNVRFNDVLIDGTYSQKEHSGYGIRLNTIWNFSANHLVGRGNWCIFGTINVNKAHIENSDINRFDIHCYGKDISFSHVDFSERYNQLASVYGDVVFEHCTFTRFNPLVNGESYNAYVGYEIYFKDCIFNVRKGNNSLLRIGSVDNIINSRKELEKKCWPNIHIKNLIVNMDETCRDFYIAYTKFSSTNSVAQIDYLSRIDIDGLRINAPHNNVIFAITPKPVNTYNDVDCVVRDIFINGSPIDSNNPTRLRSNIPLRNNHIRFVDSSENFRVKN